MALTNADQDLIERCLRQAPGAWDEFVDRFSPMVLRVVRHTIRLQGVCLPEEAPLELVRGIFATLMADDSCVLRRFRGKSSLASYVAVVARRVVASDLSSRPATPQPAAALGER